MRLKVEQLRHAVSLVVTAAAIPVTAERSSGAAACSVLLLVSQRLGEPRSGMILRSIVYVSRLFRVAAGV
jgi:hypothetical protein